MKILHQKEIVTRATICKHHNISILDVQDLIKGAVNDSFTIDGLEYIIDREEKKNNICDCLESVMVGDLTVNVIKRYKNNYPQGICKKYVCNGVGHTLTSLCNLLGTTYDPLQRKLYKVQTFMVNDKLFELTVSGYLYDMVHQDHDNLKNVTVSTVCSVANMTVGTVKSYVKNGWYSKNGWRIKESEGLC